MTFFEYFRKKTKVTNRMICEYCSEIILHDSIYAQGHHWHPHHFICYYCLKPIVGAFIVNEEQHAHRNCWIQYCAPRCHECNNSMTEEYFISKWGLNYCQACHNVATCSHCGGAALSLDNDYLPICSQCLELAVNDEGAAMRLFHSVAVWATDMNFFDHMPQPPLTILSRDRLTQEFKVGPKTLGLARKVHTTDGNRECLRAEGIIIVKGLPWPIFQMVAAHELGHVWFANNDVMHISLLEEEGFCEVVAYLWLSERGKLGRDGLRRDMELSNDPIYGEGFRRMQQHVNRHGLVNLMQLLVSQSRIQEMRIKIKESGIHI